MGAWGYCVFDDDTAYDALDDLKQATNIMIELKKYFDKVIKAECVGYTEGHYALVSAAVIDSVTNGTSYRCDCSYIEWIGTLNQYDFTSLKKMATQAIDSVLSDHSELKELWKENEKWYNDKISIKKRLVE